MKFVHAADLHLDSPMLGLERYEGAPVEQVRGATRRALENLVDLCIEEQAALLLIAGDLYDGNWRDYSTGLFFGRQVARLRHAGVRVVWIRGNHDAASQITQYLELSDNAVELSTSKPQTVRFDELGVAVHGQGFAKRAVTDDLAARYPDAADGYLNIGLLHTCLSGREGHEPYAPTRLETLASKGYDYWALGHVHERDVVSRRPFVVFPGNLQGRQVREAGPKGATLVTVDEGRIVEVEAYALDVVRWAVCAVDASEASSADDVIDGVRSRLESLVEEAEGRMVAARVRVEGASRAHGALASGLEQWQEQVRLVATDVGGELLWVERVELRTSPLAELALAAERGDAIGDILRSLRALRDDPERLAALAAEFADLKNKLPAELRSGPEALRLDDPEFFARVLSDTERTLLPRLLATGEPE